MVLLALVPPYFRSWTTRSIAAVRLSLTPMPKIIDHEARRRQVFEGSLDLFSNHGYSGLGMRQLAALGVSTGSLYHYFPNKSSLFEGMLRHLATGLCLRPSAPLASPRTPDTTGCCP